MTRVPPLSRRGVLGGAAALLTASCGLLREANAQQKVNKKDAKYQDHPNGIQRCEICLQFKPPNRCQLVQGVISPKGWCQFFAAKENAQ